MQEQKVATNIQEPNQRPLFPHPPTQLFNPPVIPPVGTSSFRIQMDCHESREHLWKSPKPHMDEKERQLSVLRQPPQQRSCEDVHMDPHYQKPPHYSQIQQHRQVAHPPIEVNKIGPTIQQGVIQHPVQRSIQPTSTGAWPKNAAPPANVRQTGGRLPSPNNTNGNVTSDPIENGRDRLPELEEDPSHNGYGMNCVHENRPFTLNDIARPVFMNHYYVGELLIPTTNKRLIKLDKCDISTAISVRNPQLQGAEREYREHS